MSAYRFCRTDDIPLIVAAWNRCGAGAPLTVAALKQEIRELDLWCSSCMVAFDGPDPVGVIVGCKRPPETNVLRLAVHPDHRRRGHARHLLTSLASKLAILGPRRLVAEAPAEDDPALALFAACGWREERRRYDLAFDPAAASPSSAGVVVAASLEEIGDAALPPVGAPRAWERTIGTLRGRAERLAGALVASAERVEAWALFTTDAGTTSVWAVGHEPDDSGEAALRTILHDVARRGGVPVILPRAGADEIAPDREASLGLTRRAGTVAFATEARGA